jgi:hypothetical protein
MYWEWKTFIDRSYPYLSGNGFAVQCQYIWNYDGFKINPNYKFENWAYIKTDYIHDFFNTIKTNEKLIIVTGNSDISIDNSYLKYLNQNNIIMWFGENVNINHEKLKSIPIGLANTGYPFGDVKILRKTQNQNNKKEKLFYCNFTVDSNKKEREYCLQQTNIPLVEDVNGGWNLEHKIHGIDKKTPNTFEGYLTDLSKSYFSISPKGNGLDSHRTWESLYVKTIPIVTKSLISEHHKDMPMVVLDDWSDFKNIEFNKDLYTKVWNNFDVTNLTMPKYLKRMNKNIS